MRNNNKIGLALSSGGIRGIAHIGVVKVLIRNNIPISYIAGSSAGSIVGAYLATYGEVETLEKKLIENSKELAPLFFDFSFNEGFINGDKINIYLKSLFKDIDFSKTKIPLYVVSTDLIKCKSIIHSSGKLLPAIRGSISIPIIFKPLKNQSQILVDGALSNPLPADILKKKGAHKVISVNLYPKNEYSWKVNMPKIVMRSVYVGLHFLSQKAIDYSDIMIEPNSSLYLNNIKFSESLKPENIKKLISIGEKAAEEKINEIKNLINKNS